jgi:hypothetical protein
MIGRIYIKQVWESELVIFNMNVSYNEIEMDIEVHRLGFHEQW